MIIRKNFYTIILLLVCYLPLLSYGQTRFYTNLSEQRVGQNQTFQVQYTVEGGGDIRDFTLPQFKDFRVEETFDMQNTVVLGQQNMQPVRSYSRIIVLSPKRKGSFVIGGAAAVIDGKRMFSNSVKITVVAGSMAPSSSSSLPGGIGSMPMPKFFEENEIDVESESILRPGEDVAKKIKKNFFLRIEASKNTCYVGEPVMVVYKAYSRINASSQVVRRPAFTGFSVLEMVDSYDSRPEIEKVNGIPYYSIVIRKVQLLPLQDGDFTLDPAEIESVVHFVKPDNNSPYGVPFEHKTTLTTEPMVIKVKPLPAEGQPADFSGAVGQFELTVLPPTTAIHRGDLVKMQVMVNGSGNLSLLTAPHVQWPRGVDTSEPEVKENINKYVYPLAGNKTFEYSFAAADTGTVVIPSAELSYFDPADRKYKTANSAPVTLHILPGMSKDKEDSLKNAMNSVGKGSSVPVHYYYFGVVVLVIIGSVIYQLIRLKRSKKTVAPPAPVVAEVVEEPAKEALPTARELLIRAQWALDHNEHILFYRSVQDNLWQVAAAKCQVLPSALNKQNVTKELLAQSVPAAIVHEFTNALQECEWALYTPSADPKDMSALLAKAEELITALQKA
ncbi:MAG: BatD family protein [Chitinophagaceae bacterium]